MSDSSKYQRLKSYLQTHYNFHANLGQYELGDREQFETEVKWRMISDIIDYVDNLDSEDKDEESDFSSILGDYYYYEQPTAAAATLSAVYGADSVPFHFFGSGSDVVCFDLC